ncbi:hypothetical protein DM02DRAFT_733037 [Periconia macrospinosa]|uniref:C2H2-type domain-containing protein n=1 Tax=Periconia macrospinosa TaxID=97972 RepID=A0A2V1D6A2_9PLEO|nr:hypothetical protein DM02DRAFT_733037 [Periconia macrospinosa]
MAEEDADSVLTSIPKPPQEISQCYGRCVSRFKELLALLSHPTDSISSPNEFNTSKALDQYVRLRTWGEESRAVLPTAARGSLDDRLRKNTTLKPMVTAKLIKPALRVHEGREVDSKTLGSSGSEDSDSTESSSEMDSVDRNVPIPPLKRTSTKIFRNIHEDIDSLYQVLLMISRPDFGRHYIHSSNTDDADSTMLNYVDFDVRHVEDKIRSWERGNSSSNSEVNVIARDSSKPPNLHEGNILAQRLGKANTKRREQLKHWSKHPDQAPASHTTDATEKSEDFAASQDTPNANSASIPSARSVVTTNTFSTVAVSDVFETGTIGGPPRTIYTDSTVGTQRSNRVPQVPRTSLQQPQFECPFCHLLLDSTRMQNRQEWKRHVFRDLRPYVCTFPDCQNPNKLYTTRRDWSYHEMQMHRRRWFCTEHRKVFSTRPEFVNHLNIAHSASILTQRQVSVLVEMSERQTDDMEVVYCPLCPDRRRLKLIQSHIAQHLESIALFVIPGDEEEEDEKTSDEEENDAITEYSTFKPIRSEGSESPSDHRNESSKKETEAVQNNDPPGSRKMSSAEKYEDTRRRITASCFSKLDKNGEPRENHNGTYSIGKTWDLSTLTEIDNFESRISKSLEELEEKSLAGLVGFRLRLSEKEYYWEAATSTEKEFFLETLVKLYNKYTAEYPVLSGFSSEELDALIGRPTFGAPK